MPKLPGTSDGHKHTDLRLYHLNVPMIMWYAKCRDFENIVSVRTTASDKDDTTTVNLKNPARRHTWRHKRDGRYEEMIVTESRDGFGIVRVQKFLVILPRVPMVEGRSRSLTHDEIYALADRIAKTGRY